MRKDKIFKNYKNSVNCFYHKKNKNKINCVTFLTYWVTLPINIDAIQAPTTSNSIEATHSLRCTNISATTMIKESKTTRNWQSTHIHTPYPNKTQAK